MNCAGFETALTGRDTNFGAPSAEMRDHMNSCAGCSALFAVLGEDSSAPGPISPALIDRITSELLADLRPVRPVPSSGHFTRMFFLLFIGVALAGIAMFQPLGLLLMGRSAASLILAAGAISTAIAASVLTRQIVPASVQRLAPARAVVIVPVALASLFLGVFPIHPGADFWKRAAVCTAIGLAAALPAGSAFIRLLRRGGVMRPRLAGSAAGLLAGLVGMVVLEVHCPILEAVHIVCSHVGPLVIAILAGFAAAPLALGSNRSAL